MEEVESTVSNTTQQQAEKPESAPINPDVILNEKGQAVYVFEKFSREQWESIEKPVDPVTQSVLNLLVSAGSRNDLHNVAEAHRVKACGETAYVESIRPMLVTQRYLVSGDASTGDSSNESDSDRVKPAKTGKATKVKSKKAKGKKTAMKSIDRIRLENFKTTMKTDIIAPLISRSYSQIVSHWHTLLFYLF